MYSTVQNRLFYDYNFYVFYQLSNYNKNKAKIKFFVHYFLFFVSYR
jgi:hypothetical protein